MASIDHEIQVLIGAIKRLASVQIDGNQAAKFGVLVRDDELSNKLEALVGTLKAAKVTIYPIMLRSTRF